MYVALLTPMDLENLRDAAPSLHKRRTFSEEEVVHTRKRMARKTGGNFAQGLTSSAHLSEAERKDFEAKVPFPKVAGTGVGDQSLRPQIRRSKEMAQVMEVACVEEAPGFPKSILLVGAGVVLAAAALLLAI